MFELFVNPFLLGGLAFASAPIILHLLNKRRYQVHDWAAMEFLLQAQVSNRRRLRFEDLLLLLLRILIIAALVFAVARPIVHGLAGWREDERIVVLDDSYSMDLASTPDTVFAAAKEAAIDQVQDAVGGGAAVSVRLGTQPEAVPRRVEPGLESGVVSDEDSPAVSAALAAKDVLDALRTATPSDLPLRFGDLVRSVIEDAREDETPRERSIVLLSDFRASDWRGADGALDADLAAAFEDLERQDLARRVRLQLVDVGLGSTPNVAVTGLRAAESPILAGVPVRIAVEVTNFGDSAVPRLEGHLEIGAARSDRYEAATRIPLPLFSDIAPGESARVEVEHVFDASGQFPLRASTTSDLLARDDELHGIAVVRSSLRVLVVDGAPAVDRFARESAYVMTALAPRGRVASGLSGELHEGEITRESLDGIDVVLVLNRDGIERGERDVLERFVADGGGLAWFLGANVDAAAYAELGAHAANESRTILFPARAGDLLAASAESPARWRFGESTETHDALRLFRGLKNPSYEAVMFSRYFALEPLEGAEVVAVYTDDRSTPAVLEMATVTGSGDEARPGGRVVIFNTTADRDWSDWPTDPSFPILLQEWVRHLARRASSGQELEVGETLALAPSPGYELRLEDDRGVEVEPLGGELAAAGSTLRFRPTRAGLYRRIARPRPGVVVDSSEIDPSRGWRRADGSVVEWIAFRRGTEESRLEALEIGQLEALLEGTGIEFVVGRNLEVDAFRSQQEGEIWRWLALATGVFLVTELFVAWWFGRK